MTLFKSTFSCFTQCIPNKIATEAATKVAAKLTTSVSVSVLVSMSVSLLIIFLIAASQAHAQATTQFNVNNIDKAIKRFVAKPHPMASDAQKKLAREIKAELSRHGWRAELQSFSSTIPNLAASQFGGKSVAVSSTKRITSENIVAISAGKDRCMVIVGGHYDTKPYQDITFVGANDGGSSTALMQEMARVISEIKKQEHRSSQSKEKSEARFLDCSIALAFFDGEEPTLKEWNHAYEAIGLVDNTYGSREFVKHIVKKFEGPTYQDLPIKAVVIIDMVGHKEQKLFITKGSDPVLTNQFLAQKTNVAIQAVDLLMEDDHQAFLKLGIPFIHIIDWTNLSEWHTANDTLNIVSSQKIAHFGDHMIRFLKQKRSN